LSEKAPPKKPATKKDGMALALFGLGLMTVLAPWYATQVGFIDPSVFLAPLFIVIGVLNIIFGIALFFMKT